MAGVPTAAALNPWLLFGQGSFDIFALLFCSHRAGRSRSDHLQIYSLGTKSSWNKKVKVDVLLTTRTEGRLVAKR